MQSEVEFLVLNFVENILGVASTEVPKNPTCWRFVDHMDDGHAVGHTLRAKGHAINTSTCVRLSGKDPRVPPITRSRIARAVSGKLGLQIVGDRWRGAGDYQKDTGVVGVARITRISSCVGTLNRCAEHIAGGAAIPRHRLHESPAIVDHEDHVLYIRYHDLLVEVHIHRGRGPKSLDDTGSVFFVEEGGDCVRSV